MLNTRLFRFRMLSACGDLMYSSTICFQRRRHSQPRKKLWTFLIFRSSTESWTSSHRPVSCWVTSSAPSQLKLPRPTGVGHTDERHSLRNVQISARSFFISEANSSHCCVYCHLAVFSLSTTCSRCTCFCSSSSFCSRTLLKLWEGCGRVRGSVYRAY